MGLLNFLINKLEKRNLVRNQLGGNIRWNSFLVSDDNVLSSSDVNEIMNDISTQCVLAKPVVKDSAGHEVVSDKINLLKHPNNYLTGTEFMQLQINVLLLKGEVFPIFDGEQLHLVSNVQTELSDKLNEKFRVGSEELPGVYIEHIKKMGVQAINGTGILDLAKNTLEGVMNAENVLTDKYKKGGLLAFLLKIDAVLNPSNKQQKILVESILKSLNQVATESETKMIPLSKGYSIETLESPVDDAKVLNYLNVYKPDLGKFFGINVDTYQELLKNDVEKAMMYLHNKSVKPLLQNIAEHYSNLLLPEGLHFEFVINPLDFVTYSAKTQIAYNNVRSGMWSPNDGSAVLGTPLSDDDEANQRYISRDLIPLKDVNEFSKASIKGAIKNGRAMKGGDMSGSQNI